jgi:3-methyl-2-oxobutanoate hydroxymethyltransferase
MPVTVPDLRRFKAEGRRFTMLTCYDVQTARIFDESGIPVLFVGDTLGIMMLGLDTTIPVTLDEMIHHCRAVRRGVREALLVGDLPFGAYEVSAERAVASAVRLVKEGGVAVVKLEGPAAAVVAALTGSGVPVMGHLGLTPQSVHATGGYLVQARTRDAADRLVDDARALERAGACALVLEAVPSTVARRVTEALTIPTIGIGAGPHCDGQVLVGTEMLGLSHGPRPRFAKRYADLGAAMAAAARTFADEVRTGAYPDAAHSYDWEVRPGAV